MSLSSIMYEDVFKLTEKDPDGKKFDLVSRIMARSEYLNAEIALDVNVDIYPMEPGDKFTLALASTLKLDGTPDDGTFDQSGEPTLANKYEYVMYGKVYKFTDSKDPDGTFKLEVFISYGGLLMMLRAEPNLLQAFDLDQRVYLLIRKV